MAATEVVIFSEARLCAAQILVVTVRGRASLDQVLDFASEALRYTSENDDLQHFSHPPPCIRQDTVLPLWPPSEFAPAPSAQHPTRGQIEGHTVALRRAFLMSLSVGRSHSAGLQRCDAFNAAMLAAVRRIRPDVVMLSAFWDPDGAAAPLLGSRLESNVTAIRATGSSICVVLDVPEVPYVMPYALAVARRRSLDTEFVYARRADVFARHSGFDNSVRALAAKKMISVVDPKDVLCSGARCDLEFAGQTLYRDSNHLTEMAPCIYRSL